MSYYKTCPYCGDHLDPGERCGCVCIKREDIEITEMIHHTQQDGQEKEVVHHIDRKKGTKKPARVVQG